MARQQALTYGVETSADGVAVVPELPGDSESGPIAKSVPALIAPRRADYGVFRAAALLVTMVAAATLLLAWLGPHHSFSFMKNWVALISGKAPSPSSVEVPTNSRPPPSTAVTHSQSPHYGPIAPENPPADPAPVISDPTTVTMAPPFTHPDSIPDASNSAPALPPELAATSAGATPAFSATPDSAFEARVIAEGSLAAATTSTDGTGQAPLLKIIGRRDKSEMTPTMWTFYFYDESAARNGRIVTVKDHKVVKNDDTLFDTDHLLSYKRQEIFSNDKLATDSSQALLTAQGLLRPGVLITHSEFELTQKDSIPAWKVTLWAKNEEGEDQKLGMVTILAEKNVVSASTLKPEWVAQR